MVLGKTQGELLVAALLLQRILLLLQTLGLDRALGLKLLVGLILLSLDASLLLALLLLDRTDIE